MAGSSSSFAPNLSDTVVTVQFVRHRNALYVHGDLGTLFVDYMLHVADHHLAYGEQNGGMLKEALAVFALHCAARPRHEYIAWTLNFQAPRLNLFLAGDNEDGTVTGRLFTENVREAEHNVFFSEVMPRRGAEKRRSVVPFDGASVPAAAEAFYLGSEQRRARFFTLGGDQYALLLSHPDCDEAWLAAIDAAGVQALPETETLALIERRTCTWHCGCSQQKILAVLAPAGRADLMALFGTDESIRVQCPRCAAVHTITREAMEAFLTELRPGGA